MQVSMPRRGKMLAWKLIRSLLAILQSLILEYVECLNPMRNDSENDVEFDVYLTWWFQRRIDIDIIIISH